MGAPRGALVTRQVLEAALLAAMGGVAAAAVAGPAAFLYNRLVTDTDIPLVLTPASFADHRGGHHGHWYAGGAVPGVAGRRAPPHHVDAVDDGELG